MNKKPKKKLPDDGAPMIEWALYYASKGIQVFPLKPKTKDRYYYYPQYKNPETGNECSWKYQATSDPEIVTAFWTEHPDANIGGATGTRSGVFVLDFDREHTSDEGELITDGFERLREWQNEYNTELNAETWISKTGRGGSQYFYSTDPDKMTHLSGAADIFGENTGNDTRGDGNYVVLPPSVHPNGHRYEWEQSPDEYDLLDADDAFYQYWNVNQSTNSAVRTPKNETAPDLDDLKSVHSCRHDALMSYIASIISRTKGKLSEEEYELILRHANETLPTPIGKGSNDKPDEFEKTVLPMVKHYIGKQEDVNFSVARKLWIEDHPGEKFDNAQHWPAAVDLYKKKYPAPQENSNASETALTVSDPGWHDPKLKYNIDKNGNATSIQKTIENFIEIIEFHPALYGKIFYNDFSKYPCLIGSVPWDPGNRLREWRDIDDSQLAQIIEGYGLYHEKKQSHALQVVAWKHQFHPIRDFLHKCHEEWDGNKYVETLLPAMLGAEKSEYTTEVMRLFMLGAVSRIFVPGCQFDYVPSLVGGQGKGKSTFFRLLTCNDEWFIDKFSGTDKAAQELLRGIWIVELGEMQITRNSKDVEAIKAFITSRSDRFRSAYGKRPETYPRQCVFVGTSNSSNFLKDPTGNRRFIPVDIAVNPPTFSMFKDVDMTKQIFRQAWGEIMDQYMQSGGKIKLVLPDHLQQKSIEMQLKYTEEDPWIPKIREWLHKEKTIGSKVCAEELWDKAIKADKYQLIDQTINNRIITIMRNNIQGWKEAGQQRCGQYGKRLCFVRDNTPLDDDGFEQIPDDGSLPPLPFPAE